jgi:hypothetical protein
VDEVVRMAKSPFLTYQIAEVIMKTSQWMGSVDAGGSHPQRQDASRLLSPNPAHSSRRRIRSIAKAGTNMALKQAAVRRL